MAFWEENKSPKSYQRIWRSPARRRCPLRSPLYLKERLTTRSSRNVTSLERVSLMVRSVTNSFFLPYKVGNTELLYQNYRYYWQSLIPSLPAHTLKFLNNLTSGKSLSSIYIQKKNLLNCIGF